MSEIKIVLYAAFSYMWSIYWRLFQKCLFREKVHFFGKSVDIKLLEDDLDDLVLRKNGLIAGSFLYAASLHPVSSELPSSKKKPPLIYREV